MNCSTSSQDISQVRIEFFFSKLFEILIRFILGVNEVAKVINTKREAQAIGGVNEKIEGFYDCCRSIGLTGNQGVMIPESNVKDLMLCKDVVEAVKEGNFHIYAVKTIDEGIEILTGKKGRGKAIRRDLPQRDNQLPG